MEKLLQAATLLIFSHSIFASPTKVINDTDANATKTFYNINQEPNTDLGVANKFSSFDDYYNRYYAIADKDVFGYTMTQHSPNYIPLIIDINDKAIKEAAEFFGIDAIPVFSTENDIILTDRVDSDEILKKMYKWNKTSKSLSPFAHQIPNFTNRVDIKLWNNLIIFPNPDKMYCEIGNESTGVLAFDINTGETSNLIAINEEDYFQLCQSINEIFISGDTALVKHTNYATESGFTAINLNEGINSSQYKFDSGSGSEFLFTNNGLFIHEIYYSSYKNEYSKRLFFIDNFSEKIELPYLEHSHLFNINEQIGVISPLKDTLYLYNSDYTDYSVLVSDTQCQFSVINNQVLCFKQDTNSETVHIYQYDENYNPIKAGSFLNINVESITPEYAEPDSIILSFTDNAGQVEFWQLNSKPEVPTQSLIIQFENSDFETKVVDQSYIMFKSNKGDISHYDIASTQLTTLSTPSHFYSDKSSDLGKQESPNINFDVDGVDYVKGEKYVWRFDPEHQSFTKLFAANDVYPQWNREDRIIFSINDSVAEEKKYFFYKTSSAEIVPLPELTEAFPENNATVYSNHKNLQVKLYEEPNNPHLYSVKVFDFDTLTSTKKTNIYDERVSSESYHKLVFYYYYDDKLYSFEWASFTYDENNYVSVYLHENNAKTLVDSSENSGISTALFFNSRIFKVNVVNDVLAILSHRTSLFFDFKTNTLTLLDDSANNHPELSTNFPEIPSEFSIWKNELYFKQNNSSDSGYNDRYWVFDPKTLSFSETDIDVAIFKNFVKVNGKTYTLSKQRNEYVLKQVNTETLALKEINRYDFYIPLNSWDTNYSSFDTYFDLKVGDEIYHVQYFQHDLITEVPNSVELTSSNDFSIDLNISDPKDLDLTYSLENAPNWVSIDEAGKLSGTAPIFSNFKPVDLVVIADNKAKKHAFNIQLYPSVEAPELSGSPITEVEVGQKYEFIPTASDPQGISLVFSITNKPEWASFDAATGKISGTATSSGVYSNITVSASNGYHQVDLTPFSIQVTETVKPNNKSSGALALLLILISVLSIKKRNRLIQG